MVLKFYLEILLIFLFYTTEFLINFILADEPFSKVLRGFETCVLVNNNLCEKKFSSLESTTTFDEILKAISLPFLIPDFNLLNFKLDNFTSKVMH